MRAMTGAAALGLAAVLLSGCSGGGDAEGASGDAAVPSDTASQAAPAKTGLDGTWKPINDDSPIETLTITGSTVRTTGTLACPGTITGADTAEPVLTLDCSTEDRRRRRGTLELKPDGSALVIEWEGEAWGGVIDSLKRAG